MKNNNMVRIVFVLVSFFMLISSSAAALKHPYMLVKESEYDSLRNKAGEYPWSELIKNAEDAALSIEYAKEPNILKLYNETTDLASALALCYIIYPEERANYVKKFETDAYKFINDVTELKRNTNIPDSHGFNVGPSQVAFMAYLALDIMYNDIKPEIRKEIEADLKYIATNHYPKWLESKYAIEGMYALYTFGPESPEFSNKEKQYRDYLIGAATEDGIYTTGPGYAHTRLYYDRRVQKKIFIDVCEYHGFHNFYSDPVLTDLHEWVFGYSITPFNRTYTFGDSPPVKPYDKWTTAALRAERFSETAKNYAAWFIGPPEGFNYINTLLDYLLIDELPMEAKKPESRIFTNGGAWLLGNDHTQNNLSAALWNINTENESHNHFDVNSLNIAGYGEFILRNSGYDNWEEPDPETWKWIHKTAESSNTITINKKNHTSFRGSGVSKSIIGYGIEYAEAESGNSIPGGEHARNLMFVKSAKDKPGYFVVYDKVTTDKENSTVDIYLHPNSKIEPEVSVNGLYHFDIKNCTNVTDDIYLDIFFNDTPDDISVKEGYFGSYEKCSRFMSKYLDAEYSTKQSKVCDPLYILYPNINVEPQPEFKRISSDNYNATEINYSDGNKDYVINPKNEQQVKINNIELQADACYVRYDKSDYVSFLCLNGKKFIDAAKNTGYESDSYITFLLTGAEGELITQGGKVRIYFPQISGLRIDGEEAECTVNSNGWADVFLAKGNHKFEILTDGDIVTKKKSEEYFLSDVDINPANKFIRINYTIPEDGGVIINLLNESGGQEDVILNKHKDKGTYSVFYDAESLKAGTYYYELVSNNKTIKKSMVIN